MESGNQNNTELTQQTDTSAAKKEVKFAQSPKSNKKIVLGLISLLFLVIGGGIGLYLTKVSQDLRQQADTGSYSNYECNLNDPNACGGKPEQCHCTGGDACTGTECDDSIQASCELQGRAYCTNYQGQGTTCCVPGYVCCSDIYGPGEDGCCPGGGGGPTNPPNNPTDPPTTITPTNTPTPSPTITITPTPTTTITPTPTPTTPVGPQCLDIKMYSITNGQSDIVNLTNNDDANLVPGESIVRLVCSSTDGPTLPAGYFYAFRIYEPCGSGNHYEPLEFVNNEGENGINYTIGFSGDYMVQCAICEVDTAGDTVCGWESLTPTACENDLD